MGILACSPKKKSGKNKGNNNDFLVLKFVNDQKTIPKDITLKIHACGISRDDPRISNIFSDTINDIKDQSKGDLECHERELYWIIKLYNKELNEYTFDQICEEIKKDRDTLDINIKQNTILYFEDNEDESEKKDTFLSKIEEMGLIYRPRMIFITKKKYKFKMKDNRYITNIIWNDYSDEGNIKLINQICSTIWNIDCYFNEKLNEMINFDLDESRKLFKGIENNISNYTFNILLTGLSRAGKSTFINLMTGKLSALESNDKESVTSKLTEYFIYPDEELKNEEENYYSIKLIDSPGIVYNFSNEVKNQQNVFGPLKKALEDKSINKIDLVLFFFREGNPLENTLEFLKLLNREDLTVLFIINNSVEIEENGENREISATISYFNQNNLNFLAIKENFIPSNFKSSKKIKFFGMNEIWKRISDILQKENPLFNNDILEKGMKNYLTKIEEKMEFEMDLGNKKDIEKNKLKDEIYNNLNKNKIFTKINKDNINKKCYDMTQECYNTIINLSNISKEKDFKSLYLAILIIEIGKRNGYTKETINNKFDNLKKELQEFNMNYIEKKDNNKKSNKIKNKKENKKKKNEIKNEEEEEQKEEMRISENSIKNLEKKKESICKRLNKLQNDDKFIKFFSDEFKNHSDEYDIILQKENYIEIFANEIKKFFEKELKNEDYIPFYFKYYNIYKNCFNYIHELSQRTNWENYEAEYINDGTNIYNEIIINEGNINDNNIKEIIINEGNINDNNLSENNINENINENNINENNINDNNINDNNINENNINEININENINENNINDNNINDIKINENDE